MKKPKPAKVTSETGELVAALQAAQRQILALEAKVDEYKWLEESLRKRTKDLNERIKELECLYAVGKFLPGTRSLAELFVGVCESLPRGFQFPSSTWASLEVYGQKFSTRGYKATEHGVSRVILAKGEAVGSLAVCVAPVFDRYHKTAVLPEEERLVEMMAALLGRLVEDKAAC